MSIEPETPISREKRVDVLLKAYDVANQQHIHEHTRSLTKLSYYLAIELAIIGAVVSARTLELYRYGPHILCVLGFACSLLWLLSHERGRSCYETKLRCAEQIEQQLGLEATIVAERFLFNNFRLYHSQFASSTIRRWETEQVIAVVILIFVYVWMMLMWALQLNVVNLPTLALAWTQ